MAKYIISPNWAWRAKLLILSESSFDAAYMAPPLHEECTSRLASPISETLNSTE